MSLKKSVLIIALVLLLDQFLKFYVKLNFPITRYGSEAIMDWGFFKMHFVENPGMAWGSKLSDFIPFISEPASKIILTTFRLFAIAGIGYWLYRSILRSSPRVLILAISLIFAGAFGNIIDSLFYNYIFDSGTTFNEEFLRWEYYAGISKADFSGYAGFMQGCVVDMLQFPLIDTTLPDWFPIWGGKHFTFFDPIFNVADMSISTGVGLLLVFNKKAFPSKKKEEPLNSSAENTTAAT
ncbi:lipoprotein signal peptidase [Sungkyunkwania multivorans]|uniref:Lipoprotein signal peptidase n=1 Tax=Sungkyunkwania multivorans TaxID=1173618 RepID=A0ABW3D346_9FLAO